MSVTRTDSELDVTEVVETAIRKFWTRLEGFLTAPTDVAELRERVEYLEDSLAAADAREARDESALRAWRDVRH